jgi:hypothetical protein
MNYLIPIEHRNQRVLTTQQLAEVYGTDSKTIAKNFERNRDRYTEGKHYYSLSGDGLTEFKGLRQNDESLKFVSILYLWTEKGAWLHAKSLNTDRAWEAYEMLVDTYYEIKDKFPQMNNLSPQLQLLIEMELKQSQMEIAITAAKEELQEIREVVTIIPGDTWREDTNRLIRKIGKKLDDYQEPMRLIYKALGERANCNLKIRLENMRARAALEGVCKSKLNDMNYLDIITNDVRLKEIYVAIVKEMAIRHGVSV